MNMKMCLNWKVVGALVAVAFGIWALAPNVIGAALPLLVLAACPLSMLAMMWAMRRGMGGEQCAAQPNAHHAENAADRGQDRVAELKASLGDVQAQGQAIAREIARLEAVDGARSSEDRDAASPPESSGRAHREWMR